MHISHPIPRVSDSVGLGRCQVVYIFEKLCKWSFMFLEVENHSAWKRFLSSTSFLEGCSRCVHFIILFDVEHAS